MSSLGVHFDRIRDAMFELRVLLRAESGSTEPTSWESTTEEVAAMTLTTCSTNGLSHDVGAQPSAAAIPNTTTTGLLPATTLVHTPEFVAPVTTSPSSPTTGTNRAPDLDITGVHLAEMSLTWEHMLRTTLANAGLSFPRSLKLFANCKLQTMTPTRYSIKCVDDMNMLMPALKPVGTSNIEYERLVLRPRPWPSFIGDQAAHVPIPYHGESANTDETEGIRMFIDTSVHGQFLRKEEFEGSENYSSDGVTIPQSAKGILGYELMNSNQVSHFRPAVLVGLQWSAYCLFSSTRRLWQQEIAQPCYRILFGSTANSRSCASFPCNKYMVDVNLSANPIGELVCSVHKRRVQSNGTESNEFKSNIWFCFGIPLVESNLTGNKPLLFSTKPGRDLRLLQPEHPWPLPVLAMSSHQPPCDVRSVRDQVNIVKNSLRLIQVVVPLLGSKSYSGRHLAQLWDPGGNTSSVWPFPSLEEIAIYQRILIGGRNSVDGIELPSSCKPTPFQGGMHLMVPAFVDHHYYFSAFLKKIHFVHAYYQIQVCTGHDHHLDFVQAHLSYYYYYPEGYHCDLGNTRKHPAPWDPGGRSPMSAWGQAEFQGGRNVMGISPASTSGEARPAHKAQAGSSDLV